MKNFNNSEIRHDEAGKSLIPPSLFLPKKDKKVVCGVINNLNGTTRFNDAPVDGIQGAAIVNGSPIIVIGKTNSNWALRCSELGDFEIYISDGNERRRFLSCNEKDMQVFINFGYGGREILIALDTRLHERGCFVNKGPKAADQIETLYELIVQYFLNANMNSNSNCESDVMSLPQSELYSTQEGSYVGGDFVYENP